MPFDLIKIAFDLDKWHVSCVNGGTRGQIKGTKRLNCFTFSLRSIQNTHKSLVNVWWCLIRNIFEVKLFKSDYMKCFHRPEAVTAKLKFHESAIYILQPQKSSFELLKVLKTDFKRQKNALSRGISFFLPYLMSQSTILAVEFCQF